MSRVADILEELPASDNIQPGNRSWGQWTGWAGAAAKAIAAHISGYIRHGSHTPSITLESAASNHPTVEYKTAEKVYRINDGGRVLKRSLRQDEYLITGNGEAIVPLFVVERLKNEAECMRFIHENTDIPVPKVLDAYEEHGSYHLWMEFINGVEMSELTDEEQSEVFPQSKGKLLSPPVMVDSGTDLNQFKALLLTFRAFDRGCLGVLREFSLLQAWCISIIFPSGSNDPRTKKTSSSATVICLRVTYWWTLRLYKFSPSLTGNTADTFHGTSRFHSTKALKPPANKLKAANSNQLLTKSSNFGDNLKHLPSKD